MNQMCIPDSNRKRKKSKNWSKEKKNLKIDACTREQLKKCFYKNWCEEKKCF